MKKKRLLITLDAELWVLLKADADSGRASVSTRINQLVEEYMTHRLGVMPWGVHKEAHKERYGKYWLTIDGE